MTLDASGLPDLPALDPEGAYLAWTVTLTTAEPEASIRDVFDFVDGDCELSILREAAAAEPFDVMALIREAQAGQDSPVAAQGGGRGAGAAGRAGGAGEIDHPRRPGPRRPADRPGGRVGDQPGDAGAAGDGIGRGAVQQGDAGAGRPGAADARDPGQRDGDPRAAGEVGVPAPAAARRASWRR